MGLIKDGPSGSNHYYNNDMSKDASLYELLTPLTTSDITKAQKNGSYSHKRGASVEADAYISGRHMLPLRRLLTEPRLVVEMNVSHSVHGLSYPYRKNSKCCSPQSFRFRRKASIYELPLRSTVPGARQSGLGLHCIPGAAKSTFTRV